MDSIINLRCHDFSKDGLLLHKQLKDKVVFVMIHASWCHYCKEALPEFLKSARKFKKNKRVVFALIQLDGKIKGESECVDIIPKIVYNFQGVPEYAVFINNEPQKYLFESRSSEYIDKVVSDFLK